MGIIDKLLQQIVKVVNKNASKLCSEGWHVPTDTEWAELIGFLGGDGIGLFGIIGFDGRWWSASE